MAVMMQMTWNGIGSEEYEAARKHVNWEGDVPPRGDVPRRGGHRRWRARYRRLGVRPKRLTPSSRDRLMPGVKELGIPGEPQVEILPAHAIFAPGI